MKYSLLLAVLTLSFYSCNNSAKPEPNNLTKPYIQSQVRDFDGAQELFEIDESINKGAIDSVGIRNTDNAYWLKNGNLVKLNLKDGYGGRFETFENYYFKQDGQVFAYFREEVNYQGFNYRMLIYFNGSNIIKAYYWFNNKPMDTREMKMSLDKVGYSLNDIIVDDVTKNSRGLLTVTDLAKQYDFEISSEKMNQNAKTHIASSSLKSFSEVQLTLMDGSLKKAKLYLGEPDKEQHPFGHITKGYAIYFNKVSNNAKPQHLVLFLRMRGNFWGDDAKIEEIYSVSDNETACFGIHCLSINDGKVNVK